VPSSSSPLPECRPVPPSGAYRPVRAPAITPDLARMSSRRIGATPIRPVLFLPNLLLLSALPSDDDQDRELGRNGHIREESARRAKKKSTQKRARRRGGSSRRGRRNESTYIPGRFSLESPPQGGTNRKPVAAASLDCQRDSTRVHPKNAPGCSFSRRQRTVSNTSDKTEKE